MKSVRNKVILYFISRKFPFDKIRNSDISSSKNNIPAAALTSRSFKTGMLYPSTSSPNLIILLISIYLFLVFVDNALTFTFTFDGKYNHFIDVHHTPPRFQTRGHVA